MSTLPTPLQEEAEPRSLEEMKALRDDVRRKLAGFDYARPRGVGYLHSQFLRVPSLLDEGDELQRQLEEALSALSLEEQRAAEAEGKLENEHREAASLSEELNYAKRTLADIRTSLKDFSPTRQHTLEVDIPTLLDDALGPDPDRLPVQLHTLGPDLSELPF